MLKRTNHAFRYLFTNRVLRVNGSNYCRTLQAVNEQTHVDNITFEFVSGKKGAMSRSGISFDSNRKPTKKMDVLILLTGLRKVIHPVSRSMEKEIDETASLLRKAQEQGAVIAATCGAAFHLASFGLLDGRRATISWWLKKEISGLFPKVKWETAKILVLHSFPIWVFPRKNGSCGNCWFFHLPDNFKVLMSFL